MNLSSLLMILSLLVEKWIEANGVSSECSSLDVSSQVIPDCNCRPDTVKQAVSSFISPILGNIVTSTFFRYFFVDLERPCPFWNEDGFCVMEGCSVCTCPEEEVPATWILSSQSSSAGISPLRRDGDEEDINEFGWISNASSTFGFNGLGHDESLGKISLPSNDRHLKNSRKEKVNPYSSSYKGANSAQRTSSYLQQLYQSEDCENFDEWTELSAPLSEVGVYVNLLQNPERFTGYAGPSARRVWTAIKEENCFGSGVEDMCLEKRIFYRLMSGLQASISTHIAKQYLHSDGRWGINLPLYWNAVGNHPDRVNNLYFAFLFLLRATVKAKNLLIHYPYDTGNKTDDIRVKELITRLVSNDQMGAASGGSAAALTSPLPAILYGEPSSSSDQEAVNKAVAECSYGFSEQSLFQVADDLEGPTYWQQLEEKHQLREEFRLKFRNISRILDCVTCEKCRLWGKLQILGLGTAIKILLSNEDELVIRKNIDLNPHYDAYSPSFSSAILNRQEVIALINTLHQFSKSVEFSSFALQQRDLEKDDSEQRQKSSVEIDHELQVQQAATDVKEDEIQREREELAPTPPTSASATLQFSADAIENPISSSEINLKLDHSILVADVPLLDENPVRARKPLNDCSSTSTPSRSTIDAYFYTIVFLAICFILQRMYVNTCK